MVAMVAMARHGVEMCAASYICEAAAAAGTGQVPHTKDFTCAVVIVHPKQRKTCDNGKLFCQQG